MSERGARIEAALSRALAPVSEELRSLEQEIETREQELRELRALRTRTQRVVSALDPAAEKPTRKKDSSGGSVVSDAQVARILEDIRSTYVNGDSDGTFTAQDVSNATSIHVTTIHKAMKVLHERSAVRIDHLGGPRNTTKFYALIGGDDA
jgi:hypothetical protein